MSLPLSLASVKTHAAFAPRVVFAAETVETGAWASGAKEPTAPLACDELYVARAKIPNDRLSRLAAHAAARRQSLVDHAGADNLRFYVLPALERLRVRHAVYLDVDCFAVRSLRQLFDAVRTSRATLVVERATAAKSARPYANTTVARHLGYRPGADDFNAGVVGADVVEASKLDMPARLADLYEAHFREPLWGPNSVNQAATVLMAKAVATAFLDSGWNCKYDVAASADGCRVFHQKPSAYVWLAAQKELPGREWRLPARVEADALRVWKEGVRKASGSDLQREVAAALDAMGFGNEEEAAVEDGFFSVDVLIANQRVVIEVDGPSHFAANNPAKVLGPTMLRRRLLRLHGYTVVTVGYREWDATAGDLGEQVSLLARVLTCEVYPRLLGETSLA